VKYTDDDDSRRSDALVNTDASPCYISSSASSVTSSVTLSSRPCQSLLVQSASTPALLDVERRTDEGQGHGQGQGKGHGHGQGIGLNRGNSQDHSQVTTEVTAKVKVTRIEVKVRAVDRCR